MSLRRIVTLILATAIAAGLVGLQPAPADAVSPVSADRAALESAIAEYETLQAQSAKVDERLQKVSSALDQAVVEEERCQEHLRTRAVAIYRSDDIGSIVLLLRASTIQDLTTRLDVLYRMASQDAENLEALKVARVQARSSAEELLDLQAQQTRALDSLAEKVAAAKKKLAASEAQVREYEARTSAQTKQAPARSDNNQKLSGSGEWKTAVASHYSRTFTGTGASGDEIGPYSMIVAHKTLPFGTLIEFEYNGKRAVAKVADRGPYTEGRTFDLGPGVVRVLDFSGVHEVRYRIITR
jgi:rare lipoprotein A (peptidoglycan hydrolase)